MRPAYQENTSTTDGDCARACIASLCEVSLSDIPEMDWVAADNDDWSAHWEPVEMWLKTRGLRLVFWNQWGDGWDTSKYPIGYALASSRSPRWSHGHAYVVHDGELVHDPWTGSTSAVPVDAYDRRWVEGYVTVEHIEHPDEMLLRQFDDFDS